MFDDILDKALYSGGNASSVCLLYGKEEDLMHILAEWPEVDDIRGGLYRDVQ